MNKIRGFGEQTVTTAEKLRAALDSANAVMDDARIVMNIPSTTPIPGEPAEVTAYVENVSSLARDLEHAVDVWNKFQFGELPVHLPENLDEIGKDEWYHPKLAEWKASRDSIIEGKEVGNGKRRRVR
eukprot:42428-Eustigmatos_ZCMA.PRE.1